VLEKEDAVAKRRITLTVAGAATREATVQWTLSAGQIQSLLAAPSP
jgi:hypothetical protein